MYAKSVGALTTQIIGEHLRAHAFSISPRDVFIRRLPLEIDLLVTKPNTQTAHGIIYDPCDVLAALEIKRSDAHGEGTARHMRSACEELCRHVGFSVPCAYITLQERKGFKYHPMDCEAFRVFCLFWHTGERDRKTPQLSDEWRRVLKWLQEIAPPNRMAGGNRGAK